MAKIFSVGVRGWLWVAVGGRGWLWVALYSITHLGKPKVALIEKKEKNWHNSMHSIHQTMLKSAQLLHKMALVQSQWNRTTVLFNGLVHLYLYA